MATFNLAYGSTTDSTALTLTLASLATSSTLVTGRASTAVVNTSDLFLDALISGQITVGTTPTANTQIQIWAYAPLKIVTSTVTYPDSITGTDAAKTMTSVAIKNRLKLVDVIAVASTTSNRAFHFGPASLAHVFNGVLPTHWGVFVTHNTGVNLNATAGNHWIHYIGTEITSA